MNTEGKMIYYKNVLRLFLKYKKNILRYQETFYKKKTIEGGGGYV